MNRNPFYCTDGYKTGHHMMYPEDTEEVDSNLTARSKKHAPKGVDKYVVVGPQPATRNLHRMFEESFFKREEIQRLVDSKEYMFSDNEMNNFLYATREEVVTDIERRYSAYLGTNYDGQHIRDLWDLGYLPIEVCSLPEGILCPIGVPFLTVRNTDKRFAWITNFLETPFSALLWKMGTAASIAYLYKRILLQAAVNTDKENLDFVDFQAHNFSMRGMDGIESASNAAIGHDVCFKGDDTLTSLVDLETFYDYSEPAVFSVNATEHSVMCAGGDENELDTFRFLMKQFPVGILSIVSDTWNLWDVCTKFLPELKDEIMKRDGKIVIRPDSGNPVDIICGVETGRDSDTNKLYNVSDLYDSGYTDVWFSAHLGAKEATEEAAKGVVELLWDVFGGTINSQGYKVLDPHIGAIYGDSITPERAQNIVDRLEKKGFASTNVVLGIGSYTYQMNTRDTFGIAMKATNVIVKGEERAIFKNPITDDGRKKSAKGRLLVVNKSGLTAENELLFDGTDELVLIENADKETLRERSLLKPIYVDGKHLNQVKFDEIRKRVDSQLHAEIEWPIIPDDYDYDDDKKLSF